MIGRIRLVAELQAALGRDGGEIFRGQLDGLTSGAPAPLRRAADPMADDCRASVLAGSLYARLPAERMGTSWSSTAG